MRIFIDSADIEEVKRAIDGGVCDGVTTNPSLIKTAVEKYRTDMESYIMQLCKLAAPRPVSLEVISAVFADMIEEGQTLFEKFNNSKNVVVKIPVNPSLDGKNNFDGLKAIKSLSGKGPVNATLVMTPEQALVAAKAGSSYVSPFAGRIDDYIRKNAGMQFNKEDYFPAEGVGKDDNGVASGVDLVRKIVDIFKLHNIKCQIIAASIRNSRQVREVAEAGAHVATIPYSVAEDVLKHPKTLEGAVKFSHDTVDEYRRVFK